MIGPKSGRARLRETRWPGFAGWFPTAVDDLGAGHAGFTRFALLEPEIVKLDTSLICDMHQNRTKQKIILSLTALARK